MKHFIRNWQLQAELATPMPSHKLEVRLLTAASGRQKSRRSGHRFEVLVGLLFHRYKLNNL